MKEKDLAVELSESELSTVAGGAGYSDVKYEPKYPVGTPVLENAFNQAIGQDSGEVIGYIWPDPEQKPEYFVKWTIKGERRHTEEEIGRFYQCWDLSR